MPCPPLAGVYAVARWVELGVASGLLMIRRVRALKVACQDGGARRFAEACPWIVGTCGVWCVTSAADRGSDDFICGVRKGRLLLKVG